MRIVTAIFPCCLCIFLLLLDIFFLFSFDAMIFAENWKSANKIRNVRFINYYDCNVLMFLFKIAKYCNWMSKMFIFNYQGNDSDQFLVYLATSCRYFVSNPSSIAHKQISINLYSNTTQFNRTHSRIFSRRMSFSSSVKRNGTAIFGCSYIYPVVAQ